MVKLLQWCQFWKTLCTFANNQSIFHNISIYFIHCGRIPIYWQSCILIFYSLRGKEYASRDNTNPKLSRDILNCSSLFSFQWYGSMNALLRIWVKVIPPFICIGIVLMQNDIRTRPTLWSALQIQMNLLHSTSYPWICPDKIIESSYVSNERLWEAASNVLKRCWNRNIVRVSRENIATNIYWSL